MDAQTAADAAGPLAAATASGAIISFAAHWLPVVQITAGVLAVATGITYFVLLYLNRNRPK